MLTLFTDASFCHRTKAMGWGAWAIHDSWDRGRLLSGSTQGHVTNSGEAELGAILWAIEAYIHKGWWPSDTVMLQSDSHRALYVLYHLLNNAKVSNHKDSIPFAKGRMDSSSASFTPFEREAALFIHKKTSGRQVWLRHVKGHKDGPGRQWVNRVCDSLARREMRKRRA